VVEREPKVREGNHRRNKEEKSKDEEKVMIIEVQVDGEMTSEERRESIKTKEN